MVTIWTYDTPAEADLARNYLEDCGFAASLTDCHVVSTHWLRSNAFGGIKLQVSESDAGGPGD